MFSRHYDRDDTSPPIITSVGRLQALCRKWFTITFGTSLLQDLVTFSARTFLFPTREILAVMTQDYLCLLGNAFFFV
jgi:hypothetical protein